MGIAGISFASIELLSSLTVPFPIFSYLLRDTIAPGRITVARLHPVWEDRSTSSVTLAKIQHVWLSGQLLPWGVKTRLVPTVTEVHWEWQTVMLPPRAVPDWRRSFGWLWLSEMTQRSCSTSLWSHSSAGAAIPPSGDALCSACPSAAGLSSHRQHTCHELQGWRAGPCSWPQTSHGAGNSPAKATGSEQQGPVAAAAPGMRDHPSRHAAPRGPARRRGPHQCRDGLGAASHRGVETSSFKDPPAGVQDADGG